MFKIILSGIAVLGITGCADFLDAPQNFSITDCEEGKLYTPINDGSPNNDKVANTNSAIERLLLTRNIQPVNKQETRLLGANNINHDFLKTIPTRTPTAGVANAQQVLNRLVSKGADRFVPEKVNKAQVMLNCWAWGAGTTRTQGQESCRRVFWSTVDEIHQAFKIKRTIVKGTYGSYVPERVRSYHSQKPAKSLHTYIFRDKQFAKPAIKTSQSFDLFFDFDSAKVNGASKATLREMSTYISKEAPKTILIEANTDTMGSSKYNLDLAGKRADEVLKIISRIYGEKNLPVPTADGVAKSGNRRVKVTFTK